METKSEVLLLRIPMKHRLKTWPEYFEAVLSGKKTFEIRKNDRDFRVNDLLLLQEYNPKTEEYTGREVLVEVTYITDFGQPDNQVVMSIARV
ncbi:ASCH/PUA domain-containing protein [Parageobacillus thermoglucosidasius]|nr:ASCH/PUA domain-containing protein [Parageobacillus thermoglucosidasius]